MNAHPRPVAGMPGKPDVPLLAARAKADAAQLARRALQRCLPEALSTLARLAQQKREASSAYARAQLAATALIELTRRTASEADRAATAEQVALDSLVQAIVAMCEQEQSPAPPSAPTQAEFVSALHALHERLSPRA
ncbi:hypothetical protein [Luteimonas aquatica]|uniref:hypothetical protein n=1 Tax=Luteimonas aquatica TaxID=450364 RepID=UPI001F5AD463|nr:hypothetical protein [Luteimonas aquatica]